MITVLCANPALDVTYRVERVARGAVHAVAAVHRRAGGKGANTARVLHRLGAPVTLVVPIGAPAGEHYAAELQATGLDLVRVPVAAPPRSSVCVVDGDATVFNEPGPELSAAEWDAVVTATLATQPDVLVLSGSLPAGVAEHAYARLIDAADARTVVDAKGAVLAAVLAAHPDVVAPNLLESQEIVGGGDAVQCAIALRARGARAAVVSAGADGLAAATADGLWRATPPHAVAGNPTGAGDALTAALAWGLARGLSWTDILRDAVATSAASVACPTAGDLDVALRSEWLDLIDIDEVRRAADHHR